MDTRKMTSDQILEQIQNVSKGLPEDEVEVEQVGSPPVEAEPSDPEVDYLEGEGMLRKEWQRQGLATVQNYASRGLPPPQLPNFEQWKQGREFVQQPQIDPNEMAEAMRLDLQDLQEKHPRTYNWFMRKAARGEIKVPENIEEFDEAAEHVFHANMTEEELRRFRSSEDVKDFIEGAHDRPLKSRSIDIAFPSRRKPRKR